MWPMARALLAGSLVSTLEEVAAAIKLLAERAHIVAEGAGATPVAAALSGDGEGEGEGGNVVCVVSGGNIDVTKLQTILRGNIP